MKRALVLAILLPASAGLAAAGLSAQPADADALAAAREAALARSRAMEAEAGKARDAAGRTRAERAAIEARIVAAEADIAAARARIGVIDRRMAAQRARLAERREPMVRLVAAVQSLARRPEILGVVQPGSLRDVVHVRALLGSVGPAIEARSRAVRAEVERTRTLRGEGARAVAGLREGAARLDAERLELVRAEAAQRLRSAGLARGALVESDRAIALGERQRELVAEMDQAQDARQVEARLALLPGPLPRPEGEGPVPVAIAPADYRLPAAGPIVAGFGELSDFGVRARGVSVRAAAGAPVAAPAAGQVVFARAFRRYGQVVIIDHGDGWSTLVTGLGALAVEPGAGIAQGALLGRAKGDPALPVTVELRRRGQPVDLSALIG